MTRKTTTVCSLLLLLAACGGSGGGSAAVPPRPPIDPPSGPATELHSGLVSAAAGDGVVHVLWDLPDGGFEAALFHDPDRASLFFGAPAMVGLTGAGAEVSGLANGQERFFSLAIRPTGASNWNPVGPALRARPAPPIYVDAAAGSQGADGTSPGSAFPSLSAALQQAAAQAGGNVWVRDGEYGPGPLSAGPGVHVFGGFGAGFDLAARDPGAGRTVVSAGPGQVVFSVRGGGADVVLDGLALDGRGVALIGVDHENSDLEMRRVTVRNFVDRGLRLRNSSLTDMVRVRLVDCHVHSNRADGLSLLGPFELRVDACRFDANAQEGMDLDDLVAPDGGTAVLEVTDSRFFGNGSEGLDVDLAAPPLVTAGAGRFEVLVRGCRFEQNGLDGLLLDQEHEFSPGWHAQIVVRECEARNNRGAGVHIDADASGGYLLHRIRATANGGDGIWISSETHWSHVVVAGSHLAANRGYGLRASGGNKIVYASHCVFAGNSQGGFSSLFPSSAASCVAHVQPLPWQLVEAVGSPTVTDPSASVFANAPFGYAGVIAHNLGTITLDRDAGLRAGDTVELADNGTARMASQVSGLTVVLDDVPQGLSLPSMLGAYPPGSSVVEDLRLAAGSVVAGTGMAVAGAGPVDPGVFGTPIAGEPGLADPVDAPLLWPMRMTPVSAAGTSNQSVVTILFSRALDVVSVTPSRVRVVDGTGTALNAGIQVNGDQLQLVPPAGGWGSGSLHIELHRQLQAADGTAMSTPLVIPLETRARQ